MPRPGGPVKRPILTQISSSEQPFQVHDANSLGGLFNGQKKLNTPAKAYGNQRGSTSPLLLYRHRLVEDSQSQPLGFRVSGLPGFRTSGRASDVRRRIPPLPYSLRIPGSFLRTPQLEYSCLGWRKQYSCPNLFPRSSNQQGHLPQGLSSFDSLNV